MPRDRRATDKSFTRKKQQKEVRVRRNGCSNDRKKHREMLAVKIHRRRLTARAKIARTKVSS
jgi:hypothetical protein